VGGVNPTIQPAGALDRRGVPATIDLDRLRVRIDTGNHMLITPVTKACKPGDYGQSGGGPTAAALAHIRSTTAKARPTRLVEFLTSDPALDDTACRYRIAHMGMSFEEETNEALARHRKQKRHDAAPEA